MPRRQLYYPKDKVSDPKIAGPGEFVYSDDGEPYVGSYVIVNNLYLTGASPSPQSRFLRPLTDSRYTKYNDPKTSRYYFLTNAEYSNHTPPALFLPKPTIKDYQRGQFQRYFVQKKNEKNIIIEISKKEYDKANRANQKGVDLTLYDRFEIQWMLKGKDALSINRANITYANEEFSGIAEYLSNVAQFIDEAIETRYYPDGKPISAKLPSAYGLPTVTNQACSNCKFVKNNYCSRWHAQIRLNYWCKAYKSQGNQIYTGTSTNS